MCNVMANKYQSIDLLYRNYFESLEAKLRASRATRRGPVTQMECRGDDVMVA